MVIKRVKVVDEPLMKALANLLPQLSTSATEPTAQYVEELISREDTHLFVACGESGEIVGMLTLLIVAIPTSRKAWIEDVVTDKAHRGEGIGEALVKRAVEVARAEGAKRIYLTSNPKREAAHRLYKRCGFEQYDTAVFRLEL
jgi:ribosomal protein S18 acetylase RimI-like enzyme